MERRCLAVVMGFVVALSVRPAIAASGRTLVGWDFVDKNPAEFVKQAAHVGFDVLITGSNDPEFLAEAVALGEQHGIKIFSRVMPNSPLRRRWSERYPDEPIPWQVLSGDEQAAQTFISAGRNKCMIPYQWGGEPRMVNEVWWKPIVCLTHPKVAGLLQEVIDTIVAVPGIEGVAFDGFGYQNYLGCRCERCAGLLEAHRKTMPGADSNAVAKVFFRGVLVDAINGLADHARSGNPDIKTTIHIWPVFAPEPLYGNRLDVDYCGQTAAWFTLWPEEKIAEYSRVITEQANAHHGRPQGVGMIGYYDKPGQFPVKTPARVEMELKTMLENGCTRIQVCSARDVIDNRAVAAVFKKYFGKKQAEKKRKSFNALGRWRRAGR